MFEFLRGLFAAVPDKPKETPKEPKKEAKKAPKVEPYVFVTLHGKKFHYDPNCPGLHGAKVYKMDLSKARAAGRKACDKCCYSYLHED